MKVLQNLAVLTAVIFIGACSTAPSADESAFLDAVKGKKVTVDGTDTYEFSSDGRNMTPNFQFKSVSSALKATYEANSGGTSTLVITLNEDKGSGSFNFTDPTGAKSEESVTLK